MAAYLSAGKDYIGIGSTGLRFVGASEFNLFPFSYTSYSALDSILRLEYNLADPVGSGFGPQGYGFVNPPITFGDLGEGVQSAVTIYDDDPNFLVSGYWPNWQISGVAGKPVVIRWALSVWTWSFAPIPRIRSALWPTPSSIAWTRQASPNRARAYIPARGMAH
jgi:hypothetical protein